MTWTPIGWIDMGEDPDDQGPESCEAAHPETNTRCALDWHPTAEHQYEHDEEGVEPYLVTWTDGSHLEHLR